MMLDHARHTDVRARPGRGRMMRRGSWESTFSMFAARGRSDGLCVNRSG